jgi:16S rRNA (cytosine967-C5)-methyltransferase
LRNVWIIHQLMDRPLRNRDRIIESLLSVGLHALTDSAQPDYAVVSATVDATKTLGKPATRGLVNALLRRFLREREDWLEQAGNNEIAASCLPQWLLRTIQKDWPDNWDEIVAAGNRQAPMWVRVNLAVITRESWLEQLTESGVEAAMVPEQPASAVQLQQPVSVDLLPGFAGGACSIQDAASQWAAGLLGVQPGMRILDACAAPGGKSGHLLESVQGNAALTALDNSPDRLQRVKQNLERLNYAAELICADALEPESWWDGQGFDRILLDAPCSATGVLRRHPDIRYLRRESDIAVLAETQHAMLKKLWGLLKPGGRLLYSTCSILRAENDAVVQSFLAAEGSALEVDISSCLADAVAPDVSSGVQLLPGRGATDGFYYALIERRPD